MSAHKLAYRYAKSLIELAIEQNQLEQIYSDMEYCSQIIKVSRDFVLLLKSPIISSDKKNAIIRQLMNGHVSPLTLSFFDIMIRKGREAYLVDIVKAFKTLYNQCKGITPVTVRSAVPLNEAFINQLVARLKKEIGLKEVAITTEINPDLIGGFVVQYEDKLLDASIARALRELKKELSDNKYINLVYSKN